MPHKPDVPCSRCGAMLWRGSSSLAAPVCRPCRKLAKGPKRLTTPLNFCAHCGAELNRKQTYNRQTFCSLTCAARSRPKRAKLGRSPYANQEKCSLRRARLKGVKLSRVKPLVVFERDSWTCHICGLPVDRALNGQHPMGPTLDHMVPLKLGGAHSYENISLAHRSCNTRKGARLVPSATK